MEDYQKHLYARYIALPRVFASTVISSLPYQLHEVSTVTVYLLTVISLFHYVLMQYAAFIAVLYRLQALFFKDFFGFHLPVYVVRCTLIKLATLAFLNHKRRAYTVVFIEITSRFIVRIFHFKTSFQSSFSLFSRST